MLIEKDILVGDTINLKTTNNDEIVGTLMPRYESADDNHIVIKLKSGYNIVIETTNIHSIIKIMPSPNQIISDVHKSTFPHYNNFGAGVTKPVYNNKHSSRA